MGRKTVFLSRYRGGEEEGRRGGRGDGEEEKGGRENGRRGGEELGRRRGGDEREGEKRRGSVAIKELYEICSFYTFSTTFVVV